MTFISRWLPAITETPARKTALGLAGLAVVGGVAAGPIMSMDADAAPSAVADRQSVQDVEKGRPSKALNVDYKAQETYFYCAPAATRIALSAQGQAPSQDEMARHLGTTEAGTNSAEDTTRVLNKIGGKGYRTVEIREAKAKPVEMDRLQVDVVKAIDANRPVVMNIKGTGVDTNGVAHSYAGGHYLTVVGYDDHGRKVKIADPANPNQAEYWMTTINLANWAAERGYSA